MDSVIFEKANESDLRTLQSFVDALYAAYPGEDGVQPDIRLTFAELCNRPAKGQLIKFVSDGMLVGYAIIVFFWSNEFSGDVIEIDELFVCEQARGKGVGRTFFRWLEVQFPSCVALALQVAEENESASRLYYDIGFKQSKNAHLLKLRIEESKSALEPSGSKTAARAAL